MKDMGIWNQIDEDDMLATIEEEDPDQAMGQPMGDNMGGNDT